MNKHLITCILLVPLVCSCGKQATTSVDTREPLLLNDSLQEIITLDTVRDTPLTNELLLNGRVSFNPERVAHVYPIFGGNVTSVHAEVGDYVWKGDVLAVIRSGEIADIDKQRKEAEHQLAIANRNLEATQDMARSGMASDRDFLQAQQEQADAEAETKRIQEMYSIYNITDPSTYVVKAPVSGFIIDKNINRDMQIRSDQGEEMFTISGLDDVWVMADVYEGDISKVKEGATVRITTLAYKDMEFTGTIDKVYHMLDRESKTMSVRVKLRNEKYMLKPGMFTNVYVQSAVKGESMPCVNAHAVIFEDGKEYVVYVSKEGYLQMREISVYKQTEKFCYLRSGLKDGDRIVDRNVLPPEQILYLLLYHDHRNRRYHQLYPYADRRVSGCDEYEGDDYHPMAGQERRGDREVYHNPDRDRHEPGTEKDGYPEHNPFRSFRHQRDVRR